MSNDPKQLEDLWEVFQLFDVDKDQRLSASDLRTRMSKMGFVPTNQHIRNIMGSVGKDETGHLSFGDFLAILARAAEASGEALLLEVFELIDRQNKGTINFDDLNQVNLVIDARIPEQSLYELVQEMDGHGDSEINFDDFSNVMRQTFEWSIPEESKLFDG